MALNFKQFVDSAPATRVVLVTTKKPVRLLVGVNMLGQLGQHVRVNLKATIWPVVDRNLSVVPSVHAPASGCWDPRPCGLRQGTIGFDGNAKLAGRVCGRPVAELVEQERLGMWTITPCSLTPLYGKRRCSCHSRGQISGSYRIAKVYFVHVVGCHSDNKNIPHHVLNL